MKNLKKLGIYLNHTSANIISLDDIDDDAKAITSAFTTQVKESAIQKSESLMHQKENHQQASFYKLIEKEILNFDVVLLFGPTDAKAELFNLIKKEHKYDKIRIETATTDALDESFQKHFMKDFFKKLI